MSDEHLKAVAKILATDNDHNLEELWIDARQAIEDEGDAAQYDPSVLLYELYLATAKEIVEAWIGGRELLTRAEWEATANKEAGQRELERQFDLYPQIVDFDLAFDAAVKGADDG